MRPATGSDLYPREVFDRELAHLALHGMIRDDRKGAPMSCAMVYWGEKNLSAFNKTFARFGAVVSLWPGVTW